VREEAKEVQEVEEVKEMEDRNYVRGGMWYGMFFPLLPLLPQFPLLPFFSFSFSLHFLPALAPFLLNLGLSIF